MFKRILQIVLHILSRHADVLSIHRAGPSYICVVVQFPLLTVVVACVSLKLKTHCFLAIMIGILPE
jgi:hypothetical protein